MDDKKFEELKRQVAEEQCRRDLMQRKKEEIEKLRNGLGLHGRSGYCRLENTIIYQKGYYITEFGRCDDFDKKIEIPEDVIKLLFEAFEIMAAKREKEMGKLK